MQRLLVIDSAAESDQLRSDLGRCGFAINCQPDLPEDIESFDLILAIESNPMSSIEIVRSLRAQSNVPLIVLSTTEGVTECVVALEVGADDYIRMPVAEVELITRIKALLRRSAVSQVPVPSSILSTGDIEVHTDARIVKQRGETIDLTPVEFDLLNLLLGSVGTLVTRDEISREVFQRRTSSCNRAIDVHMSGLRRKLGARTDGAERIRTIRGYGYIYTNGEATGKASDFVSQ